MSRNLLPSGAYKASAIFLLLLILIQNMENPLFAAGQMPNSEKYNVTAVLRPQKTALSTLAIVLTVDPKIEVSYKSVSVKAFDAAGKNIPVVKLGKLQNFFRIGIDNLCAQGDYMVPSERASSIAKITVSYNGIPCDVKLFLR